MENLIFVIPLLAIIGIFFLFLKAFDKTNLELRGNLANIVLRILVGVAVLFYSSLLLWQQFDIKIFGHYSFNLIVIVGGLSTAFMYAIVDKRRLRRPFKLLVFTMSIIPWFLIPILVTPLFGVFFFISVLDPMLCLDRDIVKENSRYRLDRISRVYTGGGTYNYHFVEKHKLYERIAKSGGYYSHEVEGSYISFIEKHENNLDE